MRPILLTLVLLVWATLVSNPASSQPKKISPDRLQGMKTAVAEIEKGTLTQRLAYPFAPPRFIVEYIDLAKKECGIDIELYRDGTPEDGGFNDVMLMEIEHRFGHGIMSKLAARAEADYLSKQKKK